LTQQPYPASEYIDLGVKVKATPAMHPNHEVTLQIEFEIRALSGSSVNGIPIISNRTLTANRARQRRRTDAARRAHRYGRDARHHGLPGSRKYGAGYAFGQRNIHGRTPNS